MVPFIEQAAAENPGLPVYWAVLAEAHARTGRHDEARTMLAAAAADGFPMADDLAWSTGIASWAEAAVVTAAAEVAPALRALLVPYHDQLITSSINFGQAIAHLLGSLDHLLGDHDTAEQWFMEALDHHQRLRSPLLIALTQASWAAVLADRGRDHDHDRAREMATAALAAAGAYGDIEADARTVLDRLP